MKLDFLDSQEFPQGQKNRAQYPSVPISGIIVLGRRSSGSGCGGGGGGMRNSGSGI